MIQFSPQITSKGSPVRTFFILMVIVCCGPLCVGFLIGYSSPATASLAAQKVLSQTQIAWFASLMNIGGILGACIVSPCLNRLGRRVTLVVSVIPAVVGCVLISVASRTHTPVSLLLLARVCCGITCGMNIVSTAVYLVELSPTRLRGTLGSCNQLGIVVGILAVYCAGLSLDWSHLTWLCITPAVILLITSPFLLESPRFLVQNGRRPEAATVLRTIRGLHFDVEEEIRELEEALSKERNIGLMELLRSPELRAPVRAAVGINILQQLSGINAVMFFTVTIFEMAGFTGHAGLPAILVALVQVVTTGLSVGLMDRTGRRRLLTVGSLLMTSSLFMLALFFQLQWSQRGHGWLALISLGVFIIGFSIGWGPVPALITAEIFPLRARSVANGLANLMNWSTSFVVTQGFGVIQVTAGPAAAFWVFCVSSFMALFFVNRYIPETKGKSLEEIELWFMGQHASEHTV